MSRCRSIKKLIEDKKAFDKAVTAVAASSAVILSMLEESRMEPNLLGPSDQAYAMKTSRVELEVLMRVVVRNIK